MARGMIVVQATALPSSCGLLQSVLRICTASAVMRRRSRDPALGGTQVIPSEKFIVAKETSTNIVKTAHTRPAAKLGSSRLG